jgi:hypothetical protein
MFEIFGIFEYLCRKPRGLSTYHRFPGVEIFDIFEKLGTAQRLWGLWEIMVESKRS